MNTCQLCLRDTSRSWNVPLFESPNFVVLPSLGALVEGWLLIVPKEHFLSFGAIPISLGLEFDELKTEVCRHIQQAYGSVCAFEHGPGKPGCSVGCGVDHAHTHIVPIEFDLAVAVAPHLPREAKWRHASLVDCRHAFNRGVDYLYLEQPIGRGRIIQHDGLGSQLFRRAVAMKLGISEQYNWRTHPQVSNIFKTIVGLGAALEKDRSNSLQPEHAA